MHKIKLHPYLGSFFLCAIVLFATPSLAANADRIFDASLVTSGPASLTGYFDVLEDPSTRLTLADIKRPDIAAGFVPSDTSTGSLNFSYTKSAYWLRLQVRNTSERSLDQLLEIANARLADVKLYSALPGGQAQLSGYLTPFSLRPYAHRFIVFPLALAPSSTQTVYLRIENTTIELPARLWDRSAFLSYERHDYMIQAGYFGMTIAMIIFNLLLFISLRDVSYLLYVVWISFVAMVMVSTTGIGMEFLWDAVPIWTRVSYAFFSLLGTSALIIFMRIMISVKTVTVRGDNLLKYLAGFNLFLAVGLFVSYPLFSKLTLMTVTIETVLVLVASVYCVFKGQRSARFFAAAFLIYVMAIIVNALRLSDVVASNVITVNGVQIGSAIEMILLAFALADRYNQLRREKSIVQMRLVETLKTSERTLEEKVAQRTSELSASFKVNKTIVMHSPLPMIVISAEGLCVEVNDAYAQLVGEAREALLGMDTSKNKFWLESELYKECLNTLSSNSPRQREIQVVKNLGKALWLDVRLLPLELRGESHVLVQTVDLTERKRHEEELKGLAFYDALTHLPNRRLLLDRLRQALATSKRKSSHGAVLFLDLNKFKQLNDTYGHEAGDKMLEEVAKRLKLSSRETDTIARLGGDEFVVLLEGLGPDAAVASKFAAQAAEKLSQSLAEEYIIGDIHHQASASTGITLFLGDGADPDQIIKDADAAMYEAKRGKPR